MVKADVLAQIERLKAIEAIEKASKDTATNKITTQSARIAQALVREQFPAGLADSEQRPGTGKVMSVAGRQDEGDGTAVIIAQRVDFGGPPAARGANGMMMSPPFAPAAER